MPELAEIFTRYGPAYLDKYEPAMLPSHRRAMRDIVRCRTESMGGQVFCCNRCGRRHYVYHSCRNRSCPKYFHLVFTVPDELHACLRSRQTQLYSILIRAAAKATIRLAQDPHYVGGLVGVLSVLHTWGRNLNYHPHVHCLVTGGGLDHTTHQWRSARDNFLIPVKVLSPMFRDTFKELSGPLLKGQTIPASVWRIPWVVNCQPVRGRLENILNYLGRYVHRIAITNNRILAVDDDRVTFGYRDTNDNQSKHMTLKAEEFIRRFLQHVLPKGFHKVRYYGLWAPGNRSLLRQLQWLMSSPDQPGPATSPSPDVAITHPSDLTPNRVCPYCGNGVLMFAGLLRPCPRGPP
jgi:hypothetical protein